MAAAAAAASLQRRVCGCRPAVGASTSGRAASAATSSAAAGARQHPRRRGVVAVAAAAAAASDTSAGSSSSSSSRFMLASGLVDYYEVLGVDDDAGPEEVKRAYRALAKQCHPDFLGDEGHNICVLLNEAYEVLSDAGARAAYNAQLETALADEEDQYTGEPLSKWIPGLNPAFAKNEDPAEDRAVFVDENTCIGCKQCVWHAPACFRIEPDHGRSRVYAQWLNTEEELQSAVDSCPVNCIHWVKKDDLPALEFVMQHRVERVNVGVMMAGQGRVADVFEATASFMKERRRKEEAQRAAARRYSPAQEEARRQATEALMRDHWGFFTGFMRSLANEIASNVEGASGMRVGARRRAARWDERAAARDAAERAAAGGDDWFMVPPSRALVPVTVSQRSEGP